MLFDHFVIGRARQRRHPGVGEEFPEPGADKRRKAVAATAGAVAENRESVAKKANLQPKFRAVRANDFDPMMRVEGAQGNQVVCGACFDRRGAKGGNLRRRGEDSLENKFMLAGEVTLKLDETHGTRAAERLGNVVRILPPAFLDILPDLDEGNRQGP